MNGDRELLMQTLANLLENALRHTPPGTAIAVRIARPGAGGAPVLAVEDDGPGGRGLRAALRFPAGGSAAR